MENNRQADPGHGLTVEDLLDRMDAIRKEMLGMGDLLATMKEIAAQAGEDDAGHVAKATAEAFAARETTLRQQLGFLERIYGDRFSPDSEKTRTERMRMILSSMNDVIPSLDYSDENGAGSVEALKVLKDLYGGLMKQA